MGMTANYKVLEESELSELLKDPDFVEEFLFPEDVDDPFKGQIDLDKSWHILHFVLTGTLETDGTPLGDAILGGEPIGPDLGYGQARLLLPGKVAKISRALEHVNIDEKYGNIDRTSPLLEKVYLSVSFEAGETEHVKGNFEALKIMYQAARKESKAVLAYLA